LEKNQITKAFLRTYGVFRDCDAIVKNKDGLLNGVILLTNGENAFKRVPK
jgi:hypothetical protein